MDEKYGGDPKGGTPGAPAPTRPKVTVRTIRDMKQKGERITSVTAYDYPSARIADEAGIDLILVGDSLGMVVLGYESTIPVTMAEMSHHLRAVMRAQPKALVIVDLPFASFQAGPEDAVRNSARLIKRGAEGVKLEGGRRVLPQVDAILAADIPVLGHLGLTPQSVHSFGGYRVQARGREAADALLGRARARARGRLRDRAGGHPARAGNRGLQGAHDPHHRDRSRPRLRRAGARAPRSHRALLREAGQVRAPLCGRGRRDAPGAHGVQGRRPPG